MTTSSYVQLTLESLKEAFWVHYYTACISCVDIPSTRHANRRAWISNSRQIFQIGTISLICHINKFAKQMKTTNKQKPENTVINTKIFKTFINVSM